MVKNEKQDAKAISAFIREAFKVSDGALVVKTTGRKIALIRVRKLSQKEFEKTHLDRALDSALEIKNRSSEGNS